MYLYFNINVFNYNQPQMHEKNKYFNRNICECVRSEYCGGISKIQPFCIF